MSKKQIYTIITFDTILHQEILVSHFQRHLQILHSCSGLVGDNISKKILKLDSGVVLFTMTAELTFKINLPTTLNNKGLHTGGHTQKNLVLQLTIT